MKNQKSEKKTFKPPRNQGGLGLRKKSPSSCQHRCITGSGHHPLQNTCILILKNVIGVFWDSHHDVMLHRTYEKVVDTDLRIILNPTLHHGGAEAAFVGDVEDAGTFGDFLGGPTEIDRESKTPQAELANRLKFGLEGGLFTLGIGAGARGISKLRNYRFTFK